MQTSTNGGLGSPATGVVVTGGASGIGRATCLALAEVGRPVAVWDVNGEGAAETAASCAEAHGVASHAVAVDVADRAAIEAAAAATASALPSLGGLVHAAGVGLPGPVEAPVGHGALPAYCASKAGLLGLTRSMAHSLGFDGIRVNAVCPGAVDTPMLAPLLAAPGARRAIEQRVPLGRVAEPRDIARAVRFLLSDEAAYVHGTYLVVDGGMTAVG